MEYLGEIFSFILGALGGSFITYKVTNKSMSGSGHANVVDQAGAKAGRDVVGGNQTKS